MVEEEKLTKAKLLEELRRCASDMDEEKGHIEADRLLIAYIADEEIANVYNDMCKWYS